MGFGELVEGWGVGDRVGRTEATGEKTSAKESNVVSAPRVKVPCLTQALIKKLDLCR